MTTAPDWFLPGGAVIDESRQVKLRLRPPPDWTRVIIDLPRVPPSMNRNSIRSNWRGFQTHKKLFEDEISLLLMAARCPRRRPRAMAGGFLRFSKRAARRDPPNYRSLLDKALGDAMTRYGAIPDDDQPHYFFGGVEIEPDHGPDRTQIHIFLAPPQQEG